MSLISLHTRFMQTIATGQACRAIAQRAIIDLAQPVPVARVLAIAAQLRQQIAIASPEANSDDLAAYARTQFGNPAFDLKALIAGGRQLAEAVIAAVGACLPTHNGQIKTAVWNADGTTTQVMLDATATAPVRSACVTLREAIPE